MPNLPEKNRGDTSHRAEASPILVVGDDHPLQDFPSKIFEQNGFSLLKTATARSALADFEKKRPDLVLIDLASDGLDVPTLCESLRWSSGGENVPILLIAEPEDFPLVERGFAAGATDCITKPLPAELILHRVRYMLRSASAMANLTRSQARLAEAQRIALLGHWDWDVTAEIFTLSDEAFRISGLSPLSYDNSFNTFLNLVHDDDRKQVETIYRRARQDHAAFSIEHRLVTVAGDLRHVHIRGEVSVGGDGPSIRVFGTVQDITAQKETQEELIILKEAIDCLPIGITVTDTCGRIVFTNPAEAEIHGYSREEMLRMQAGLLAPTHLRKPIPLDDFGNLTFWKRESTNIRKDGKVFPVHLTSIPVRNSEGRYLGFVTACEDITARKSAENKIEQLAYFDALTGLPNRRMFLDRLGQSLALADVEQWKTAVLFLDLDRFKDVNDSLGHSYGDKLLRAVAQRLQKCMRKADTLARLGGDEFVVILTDVGDRENAAYAAQRILESFALPFEVESRQTYATTSIGIALHPTDGKDLDELVKNADAAMYYAKSQGGQTYRFFSPRLNKKIQEKVAMESDLRKALDNESLTLFYQPQFELSSNRLIGIEALIRWQCPVRGFVEPAEIIQIAEETGLIYRLGEWILRTACTQFKEWSQGGGKAAKVAVNVSGRQFSRPDFLEMIELVLEETGLDPRSLEIELTESAIMEKSEKTVATLKALKAKGILLSIDDFGTGYSSLSYLQHFPIDRIKIDRSFVRDLPGKQDDTAIVEAIIAMAHRLNLKVLAEGVEVREHLDYLRAHHCHEAQGYYFSPPVPLEQLMQRGGDDFQNRAECRSDAKRSSCS